MEAIFDQSFQNFEIAKGRRKRGSLVGSLKFPEGLWGWGAGVQAFGLPTNALLQEVFQRRI
jgi:hypothetical protein